MQETSKARQAFEDYYALGPGRSLAQLARAYQSRTKLRPPTRQISTLKEWSTAFGWQARVAQRDAEIAAKALAELEARRKQALESGFALYFERVARLKELADLLWHELNTDDKRWLPDVKQIGSGDDAERVDIVRFNAALVEQFRATLDDIAAEKGERVKGIDLTGELSVVTPEQIEEKRRRRWDQVAPALAAALNEDPGD